MGLILELALGASRPGLDDVTLTVYPEARHEIFNETNRNEVYTDLIAWLEQKLPSVV